MKRFPILMLAALAVIIGTTVATLGGPADAQSQRPASGVIPGEWIVIVDDGVDPATVANGLARSHGAAVLHVYRDAINGFAFRGSEAALNALLGDDAVASVVPNRVVTIEHHRTGHGGGPGGGGSTEPPPSGDQAASPSLDRIGAKGNPKTGAGVTVAILDTGVDPNTGDLTINASLNFDAFGGDASDQNGHGTNVAGIVGALNNSVGVLGVAPDVTIVSVRVLDASGAGSDADVISGLNHIAANAASIDIVNISLGRSATLTEAHGTSPLRTAVDSVRAADIIIVASAGNSPSSDLDGFVGTSSAMVRVPAVYADLAVASTTTTDGANDCKRCGPGFGGILADTASYFTTDGTPEMDGQLPATVVSAPGELREDVNKGGNIKSIGIESLAIGGGTSRMSGTSQASPHVAGLVALYMQAQSSATDAAIITAVINSADRSGTVPLNSPTSSYSFDGEREGIVQAPQAR